MAAGNGNGWLRTILALLIGLGVGYAAARYIAPPPPAPEKPHPRVREARFGLKDKKLAEEHAPLYLTADRGDKIVWKSDSVREFTVMVGPYPTPDDAWYKANCAPGGPVNPFQSAEPKFDGANGRAESAAAKPEARGHCYKFTITAPGYPKYDPHIIFD